MVLCRREIRSCKFTRFFSSGSQGGRLLIFPLRNPQKWKLTKVEGSKRNYRCSKIFCQSGFIDKIIGVFTAKNGAGTIIRLLHSSNTQLIKQHFITLLCVVQYFVIREHFNVGIVFLVESVIPQLVRSLNKIVLIQDVRK